MMDPTDYVTISIGIVLVSLLCTDIEDVFVLAMILYVLGMVAGVLAVPFTGGFILW